MFFIYLSLAPLPGWAIEPSCADAMTLKIFWGESFETSHLHKCSVITPQGPVLPGSGRPDPVASSRAPQPFPKVLEPLPATVRSGLRSFCCLLLLLPDSSCQAIRLAERGSKGERGSFLTLSPLSQQNDQELTIPGHSVGTWGSSPILDLSILTCSSLILGTSGPVE